MCHMVNETKADWVELNVSCPFSADMGVKMGAGDVDRAPLIVSSAPDSEEALQREDLASGLRSRRHRRSSGEGRRPGSQHVCSFLRLHDRHRDRQSRSDRERRAAGADPTCSATD